MLNKMLTNVYVKHLDKLKEELNAYKDEKNLWRIEDGISNSAGNLTLHLIGNLNHFIGAVLGNSGYVREREKEFSNKDVPRAHLIESIDKTIVVVQQTLAKISDEDFGKVYPAQIPGSSADNSTHFMILHLVTHLAYHLGQINYHRRLIDK